MLRAARYFHRRNFWKHLPVLVAGVLAGYLVGCNKPALRQALTTETTTINEAPVMTNATTETPQVRAAIVALVRNSDLFGLRLALRQIEDRFNHKHKYPYVFVNDVPFTDEFMQGVRDVTSAPVEFGQLDEHSWGIPEWIDQERYAEAKRTAQYPHAEKDSYRKMCRFQSGFLHHHPLLRNYDYYWRIEPDVEYYCDIDYDPFVFMKQRGIKYGWNIAMTEFMSTVETLWNTTEQFLAARPDVVSQRNLRQWLLDDKGAYTGCHFWSNFEIVDLSFYRSEAYQAYFDHLDRAGGFFYERWGDAPVHSIAAAMLLDPSEIHYFDDIGYFHPSVLTCPRDARTRGSCVCDSDRSFVQNGYCTVRYKQVRQYELHPDENLDAVHTGPVIMAQPYVVGQHE